jgi:hypothetical protein
LKAFDHAVENHSAEHWTAVIAENENDGFFRKVIGETNVFAVFVTEVEVEGDCGVEFLIEFDFSETGVGECVGRDGGRETERAKDREKQGERKKAA